MEKKPLSGAVAAVRPPGVRWRQEERPPTRAQALAALWRVRLRLGQCPVCLEERRSSGS